MSTKVEIKVPDIGDFEGVEIIEVLVAEGDTVAVDDGLVTLETDKAAMDVPSTHAGKVLELKVKQGDKVSQGDVIAVVEATEAEEKPPVGATVRVAKEGSTDTEEEPVGAAQRAANGDDAKAKEEPAGATERVANGETPDAEAPAGSRRIASLPHDSLTGDGTPSHASPSVRKLARELGVDLSRVSGSGRKNRITHDDIKSFVKGVMQGGGSGGGFSLPQMPTVDFSKWGPVETVPLGRIKRIAGPHLQRAWITIPHVTQHDEADITDLEVVRKALKSDAEARDIKLTPLAFVIKACVIALKEFPDFNASLDPSGQNLVHKNHWHIGFAVDTPEGLVVPVIRDADQKDVFGIAAGLAEISAKARDRKLKADDMQGGTFSVSSLGGIGGTAFTPIVNAPEVAILGVSRTQVRPVWDGNAFRPRSMLPLSLSYDHRVIDGAAAARFTTYLADVLREVRELVL